MNATGREAVVFVHGIWLNGWEMALLRRRVARCGYRTFVFHYPSVRCSPREGARRLHVFLQGIDAEVIHLVAHSLGGIVVLHLFEAFPERRPGRVVFIGTPAQGSAAARVLARHRWLRPLLGRAGERGLLGGAPAWRARRDLGVIAGTHGLGLGLFVTLGRLPRPHDGTVSLAETAIPGARDRFTVPAGHLALLLSRRVAAAVCRFLASGRF